MIVILSRASDFVNVNEYNEGVYIMDKSKNIFGNPMPNKVYKKALRTKNKYQKKFGDDSKNTYNLKIEDINVLTPLNTKNLVISNKETTLNDDKGIIIGNIRMGFGHYRISIAMASAANALGYNPYWLDLHSFENTTCSKLIEYQNSLYSLGSRLSQKSALFNKFIWEPTNYTGFKKLSYNSVDQKNAELMANIYSTLPKDMPCIATHVWPAQAAIHAGMKNVVNAIPDNWPMALHLAEGSIHLVQTPSSYLGYRTLKGMHGNKILNPMPASDIFEVGHYIDHELVVNLENDCNKRLDRINNGKAKRFLLTIGGAGAQQEFYSQIIKKLLPLVKKNEVVLYLNVGDHKNVWDNLASSIPELKTLAKTYFNDWNKTKEFTDMAIDEDISGVHVFYNQDIFAAVYSTNLLMRSTDVLVTKPSELSFYPVPKLLIKRVGGHEMWGAITSSEIGDGTIECETPELALQMIDLMLSDNYILNMMCKKIIDLNKIGRYNGAYKAVEIAMAMKQD